MSRRQARIIKSLRAELASERTLLRAYQTLYGKTPQEQQPMIYISGSTNAPLPAIPPAGATGIQMYINGSPYCPQCGQFYSDAHPHYCAAVVTG